MINKKRLDNYFSFNNTLKLILGQRTNTGVENPRPYIPNERPYYSYEPTYHAKEPPYHSTEPPYHANERPYRAKERPYHVNEHPYHSNERLHMANQRSKLPTRSGFRLLITGLPLSGSWQDIKDHCREAGEIVYSKSFMDGTGFVDFARDEDMRWAMDNLDDSNFRSHKVSKVLLIYTNHIHILLIFCVPTL